MYTSKRYKSNRTWILRAIKPLRSELRIAQDDILFDQDSSQIKEQVNRIKAHQELLLCIRNEYYSQ